MIISKLINRSRHRRYYLTGDAAAACFCSSSGFSAERGVQEARLQETASMVCDTIRRRPRWESSILSLFPSTSGIFHPNCISFVIRGLSGSNPLLSFRYFLWLSTTSSSISLDPETAASFLGALATARAWRAALHAIRSMKCLAEPALLNSFVLHVCSDTRSMYRDKTLLHDLCDVIETNSNSISLPSWNSALSASLRMENTDIFHQLYTKLIESGINPDAETASYLIRALCRDGEPIEAFHVLRDVSRKGVIPDVVSLTQLISYFSKAGNFGRVSGILHLMIAGGSPPDLFTYQAIIHALCDRAGGTIMVDEAFRIFRDLKMKGYFCDVVTYTTMINGFCMSRRMEEAWLLWYEMVAMGIQPNHYTYNAIINGYCKAGDINNARNMYDKMLSKGFKESTLSCNTMLYGICFNGRMAEAITMFHEMPKRGIERDLITYNTLIQGLCREGKTSDAIEFYSRLIAAGIKPSISTYTPLIVSLCNEKQVTFATELMEVMEAQGLEPLVCMNDFIIVGFCHLGDAEKGMAWLEKMLQSNLKPQAETLNRLVECLSLLGRVDDALQLVYNMLESSYILGSTICHLIISKLCREDSYQAGLDLDDIMVIDR